MAKIIDPDDLYTEILSIKQRDYLLEISKRVIREFGNPLDYVSIEQTSTNTRIPMQEIDTILSRHKYTKNQREWLNKLEAFYKSSGGNLAGVLDMETRSYKVKPKSYTLGGGARFAQSGIIQPSSMYYVRGKLKLK